VVKLSLGFDVELGIGHRVAFSVRERQVLISCKNDEIVWIAASSRSYSSHLGCLLLHEDVVVEANIWKDCLEPPWPPKA
ncbi:hypothetical protein KI387_020526, partial [Taxus chinensis]